MDFKPKNPLKIQPLEKYKYIINMYNYFLYLVYYKNNLYLYIIKYFKKNDFKLSLNAFQFLTVASIS